MLFNEKGFVKSKVMILSLLVIVLVTGLIYLARVYPPPQTILTVGSIGGAERVERYRNPDTGQIELDKNEINLFFQSVEWQNISKDPELLAIFTNKDMMNLLKQTNSVKQFIGVYNSLENYVKANNLSQTELSTELFESLSVWINTLPVEQAIFIKNIMENQQFEQLINLYSSIGFFSLPENEKFEALFNVACLWSFRASDRGLLSSRDIETFKAGFTALILNSETGMNLVNAINSHNFMDAFIRALMDNLNAIDTKLVFNQDLGYFVRNNTELQNSISQFINNTDFSNIINSNVFSRIIYTNQDFSNLLEAIRY